MDIIFNNQYEEVRREACSIFSFCVQNNPDVQNIVSKLGALNLTLQFVRETNVKNQESVLGALSSYLRGHHFKPKISFLNEFSGLSFIKQILKESQNKSVRLAKKLLFMVFDLVLCDDQLKIQGDPTHVRKFLAEDKEIVVSLTNFLSETNLEDY